MMMNDFEHIADNYLVRWTLDYVYEHPELTEKEIDDLWYCCSKSVSWMNRQTQNEFNKVLKRLSETSKNREQKTV